MWLDTYGEKQDREGPDRRAETGKQFGEVARAMYPEGKLVDTLDLVEAAHITAQLIDSGASTLFEAAFVTDDVAVRIDILQRNGAAWNIIEVKASNSIKDIHCDDAAIQQLVCEASGLKIGRVFILHLNSEHRHPNVQPLTLCEDVTDLLEPHLKRARSEMPSAIQTLRSPSAPVRSIGSQCKDDCPHHNACFADVPKYSIFNIPRLANKKDDLIGQGILAISEVPLGYKLTETQRVHVNAMSTGSENIDRNSILRSLSVLKYPLHFFDFEAFDPAMPLFDGTWPYQHIPFQFSCHILQADGTLEHKEFLYTDQGDPRPALLLALREAIGVEGSVIVYSAQYERRILRELAVAFRAHEEMCNSIISRLWDQAEIFKSDYIHPDFQGSYSIKAVLPVLVPQLSYQDLDHVQNGTDAQDVWWEVVSDPDQEGRDEQINSLREYCQLDTYAMVELHRYLSQL